MRGEKGTNFDLGFMDAGRNLKKGGAVRQQRKLLCCRVVGETFVSSRRGSSNPGKREKRRIHQIKTERGGGTEGSTFSNPPRRRLPRRQTREFGMTFLYTSERAKERVCGGKVNDTGEYSSLKDDSDRGGRHHLLPTHGPFIRGKSLIEKTMVDVCPSQCQGETSQQGMRNSFLQHGDKTDKYGKREDTPRSLAAKGEPMWGKGGSFPPLCPADENRLKGKVCPSPRVSFVSTVGGKRLVKRKKISLSRGAEGGRGGRGGTLPSEGESAR